MRIILLFAIFLCAHKSICQDSSKIFGRWRVVVMDNGVRYDYKTEKYTVSKALQDSLNKWKDNSLFDLEGYISWAASCPDCYYLFKQGGVYQEFREMLLGSEGTFTILPNDSLIKIIIKVRDNSISKDYKYNFIGQRLILSVPSFFIKENLTIELERVD